MLRLLKHHYSFVIIGLIYLISVIVINPFSEYAINDDWDFITHVRNFRNKDFIKNSLIDSSFILQGFVGTGWTYLFGFSYLSLKALTVVVTLVMLFGISVIFAQFRISHTQKTCGLAMCIFNPFVYPFSITFMTELYFLVLVVWSVFFYIKYAQTNRSIFMLLAIALASLSLLVRQLGLLLAPAFFVIMLIRDAKDVGSRWKIYVTSLLIFICIAAVSFLWPQYNSDLESPMDIITQSIRNPIIILSNIPNILYLIPYLGISVTAFGLPIFFTLRRVSKLSVLIMTIFLFKIYYSIDVFKLGNTLYPEGLMVKNNYISHITLYDNSIFKALLALVLLISALSIIASTIDILRKNAAGKLPSLLFLAACLILPLIVQNNFYDRYLVNGLIVFAIFTYIININRLISRKIQIIQVLSTLLISLYVFSISYDLHKSTQIQWKQAAALQEKRLAKNDIFLSDTYSKYVSVFYKPNGPAIVRSMPQGITYRCYIQKDFTADTNNLLYKLISKVQGSRSVNQILPNPKIFGAKTSAGYRQPSRDSRKIISVEKYSSWPENVVGNNTFIVTYCNDIVPDEPR